MEEKQSKVAQIVGDNPGDLEAQRDEIRKWNETCQKAIAQAQQIIENARLELVGTSAIMDLLEAQIVEQPDKQPEGDPPI